VQPLIATALVLVEMTRRVEDDRALLPPLRVHPQHCLLRHRAARQEDRCLLAEHRGHLILELGDDTAVAVAVDLGVGRNGRQQVRGPHRAMAMQEAAAQVTHCGKIVSHAVILPGFSVRRVPPCQSSGHELLAVIRVRRNGPDHCAGGQRPLTGALPGAGTAHGRVGFLAYRAAGQPDCDIDIGRRAGQASLRA